MGTALTHIPAIGTQLNAVMGNLQLGIAGAATSMLAMLLYDMVMDGVMGIAGTASPRAATA